MEFFTKIKIVNDCWVWTGQKNERGYGRLQYNKRIMSIHRIIYTIFKGNIPNNLEIDHLCRNHSCCNPNHLEAVTHKINTQRGLVGKHKNHIHGQDHYLNKRTHCPQGHEYNIKNTYVDSENKRHCRVCNNIIFRKKRMIK